MYCNTFHKFIFYKYILKICYQIIKNILIPYLSINVLGGGGGCWEMIIYKF